MLDHLKRHAIIAFFLCYEHLWLTTTWSYNEDTSKGLIHLVPLPQDLGGEWWHSNVIHAVEWKEHCLG